MEQEKTLLKNKKMAVKAPRQARFSSLLQYGQLDSYPLWMMRQAGRYLPEYHLLKEKVPSFLHACKNPKIASQITLQPLRRFELDAAIIFADILLILEPLGFQLSYSDKGPEIQRDLSLQNIVDHYKDNIDYTLDYVGQALEATASELHKNHTLIGFCGAPWTVALYALDEKRSLCWSQALKQCYEQPDLIKSFLEILIHASMEYLSMQVNHGAQVVMIFDSWIEQVPLPLIKSFAFDPSERLIQSFKARHPHIPVIYYPKGKSELALRTMTKRPDVIAIDHHESLEEIAEKYQMTCQGNIDHRLLFADKAALEKNTLSYLRTLRKPSIINLSHGILKNTPVQNVEHFVQCIRKWEENIF